MVLCIQYSVLHTSDINSTRVLHACSKCPRSVAKRHPIHAGGRTHRPSYASALNRYHLVLRK